MKIASPLWPLIAAASIAACTSTPKTPTAPVPTPVDTPVEAPPQPKPEPVRDPELEQKLARTELRLMEKEAQVDELQQRLDDARQEVVRAMAKLQSLATRAEAASGIAEAELALQSLRSSGAPQVVSDVSQLMRLSTAEFDKKNYGGALYLANQAKSAAVAARGRLSSDDRAAARPGEVAFALPLRLQTSGRTNVREGPGSTYSVSFTLPAGAPVMGYSYAEQWVRVSDDSGRRGWVFQGLVTRRP
jgi:hypothetical protein